MMKCPFCDKVKMKLILDPNKIDSDFSTKVWATIVKLRMALGTRGTTSSMFAIAMDACKNNTPIYLIDDDGPDNLIDSEIEFV